MDGTKAIQDEKDTLAKLNAKSVEYIEKIKALDLLSNRIKEFVDNMSMDFELSNLSDPDISSSVKNNEINEFRNRVDQLLEDLNREAYKLGDSINSIQTQILELDEIIKACKHTGFQPHIVFETSQPDLMFKSIKPAGFNKRNKQQI